MKSVSEETQNTTTTYIRLHYNSCCNQEWLEYKSCGSQSVKLCVLLTANRSTCWSGSGWSAVCLSLTTIQDGTSKYGLQFFGVWGRDGEASDWQLYQGQAHTPHIWLHRIVGPLQSLRLHSKHKQQPAINIISTNAKMLFWGFFFVLPVN